FHDRREARQERNGESARRKEEEVNRFEGNSFAHAVQGDRSLVQQNIKKNSRVSYTAMKETLQSLQKSYVGEVIHAGMTYNIHDEFHRQGYFGIKITPLGANLVLLEEQETGEVQALMEDAKSWLEQWFRDIRPWTTREADRSRLVWLRVYGIPVHAWNVDFFSKLSNKYGAFINEDDGTLKMITMDVAQIMIRTVEQKVIDELVEVDINNEIFQLRIIEDSYGPMRIMVAQEKRCDGRDAESNQSDEEEDENSIPVEEEDDLSINAGDKNLLALTNFVNDNNGRREDLGNGDMRINGEELNLETTYNLNGGENSNNREVFNIKDTVEVIQVENSRGVESGRMGPDLISSPVTDRKGVHREPSLHKIPSKVTQNKHVGVRNSIPLSSKLVNRSIGVKEDNTCTRNPPGRFKASNGKENSVSSAGSILCCSSLNSSDIRNCNKQFWNRNDMAMADKVWKGVVELGVEGEEVEEVYRGRISNNEKRDTETKKSREHNKQ
ncbi:hypothetical protein A2U01_0007010, partial [Trifolium medium]|nr:hypothetical protein [Trifolium medium]